MCINGNRMKQEMVRGGLSTSVESGWGGGPRDSMALEAEFASLWGDTWSRGRLDIIGTRQMARLLQVRCLNGYTLKYTIALPLRSVVQPGWLGLQWSNLVSKFTART